LTPAVGPGITYTGATLHFIQAITFRCNHHLSIFSLPTTFTHHHHFQCTPSLVQRYMVHPSCTTSLHYPKAHTTCPIVQDTPTRVIPTASWHLQCQNPGQVASKIQGKIMATHPHRMVHGMESNRPHCMHSHCCSENWPHDNLQWHETNSTVQSCRNKRRQKQRHHELPSRYITYLRLTSSLFYSPLSSYKGFCSPICPLRVLAQLGLACTRAIECSSRMPHHPLPPPAATKLSRSRMHPAQSCSAADA
jgi:hypothetical protein